MSDNYDFENEKEEKQIAYIDLEQLQYGVDVLYFLRKKLDNFTIDCLRKVKDFHNLEGLHKTKLENYKAHRKKYDAAFLTLEVQGFIEKKNDGKAKPYYLSVRGFQLIHLLVQEKNKEKAERE